MSASIRIQLSRKKGWRMPPNTVKVDRSTNWGNPFVVGIHGTRERCVRLFRFLMTGSICVSFGDHADKQISYYKHVRRNRQYLRGKNLACWCPLDQPCHADVLLELANQ